MMLLQEVFMASERPDHTEHADPKTGFYGQWGAGAIIMARSTNRFLIAHRSNLPPPRNVEQPGTWGTWGGAGHNLPTNRNIIARVVREIHQETKATLTNFVPIYIFKSGTFEYYNFLAVVEDEFTPVLNWENQGFRWCEFGDWPQPLHFGLQAILKDAASIATMRAAMT
jgi:hypothetical protein